MTSVADNCREDLKLIEIDQGQLRQHVDGLVKDAVEDTLNALLDAEADGLCGAKRYERSPDRTDFRAGSYRRTLHTKAGEVELKMPKLRKATFESQVIERYRRRESSIEEALVEMYLAGVSVRRVEDITECCGACGLAPHRQRVEPAAEKGLSEEKSVSGICLVILLSKLSFDFSPLAD